MPQSQPPKHPAENSPAAPRPAPKILAFDDSPLFRESLKRLADKGCFEIAGETDQAEELLQLIETASPQAILLDLAVPGQNAIELIGRIKKLAPDLPLIACSGLREEHVVSKALEAGCFDYIFKPFEEKRLAESVQRAVQRAAA